jgi:RNA polymerase sigma-70 factor (ECF subfamily)
VAGELPDTDLVREYQRSADPALFETLMRRHWDRIVRVVLSVIGPDHAMDAEDLAQQVLISAHDKLSTFRGEARLSTWLYRIASNKATDHLRRVERRRRMLLTPATPPDPDPVTRPDELVLTDERAIRVQRALKQIPQPYQAALRLRYWFDLPVQEVAESLGVAEGTAKSYLHRGRDRLRRLLDQYEVMS